MSDPDFREVFRCDEHRLVVKRPIDAPPSEREYRCELCAFERDNAEKAARKPRWTIGPKGSPSQAKGARQRLRHAQKMAQQRERRAQMSDEERDEHRRRQRAAWRKAKA